MTFVHKLEKALAEAVQPPGYKKVTVTRQIEKWSPGKYFWRCDGTIGDEPFS